MPTDEHTKTPETRRPKRAARARRWRWWISRGSILLVAVFLLTVVLVTQTGVLTSRVVPIIERETGLDVVAARVLLTGSGDIALEDAVLRAPDIDGLGGELVRLDRAVLEISWPKILSGAGAIERVTISRPRLRVSQDKDTGSVNLAALRLSSSGGDALTPEIHIQNGILEIGEHQGHEYRLLKELAVEGELLAPDTNKDARLSIAARPVEPEIVVHTGMRAQDLFITGVINEDGLAAELTGLTLERWPASIVPSRVRPTYEALALSGELAPTRFVIDKDGNASATLRLSGVDLNLPFGPSGAAPGEVEPLRMRGTRGEIRFGASTVTANLAGEIDRLDYGVDLTINGYSNNAAFNAELTTRVRFDEGFRPLLFVPENITEELDRFSGLSADVFAKLKVERGTPTAGAPAQVLVSGTAEISNATASYKEFPYPIHDMSAVVHFDSDHAQIESLEGYGETGAKITASGLFDGFGDGSVVHLSIVADEIPIDETLKRGLSERQRELVETLFSQDKHAKLIERGLILEPGQRAVLQRRRLEAAQRLAQMNDSDPMRAELESRLVEFDRRIAAPEFRFEGAISIHVDLRRDPQRPSGDRWTTDVHATLPHAGIVPDQFPLPIVARDVELVVKDGLARLEGGRYEGLAGGWAEVQARVGSGSGPTNEPPTVRIRARNIPIDQRLIAAIPGYDDTEAQIADDAPTTDRDPISVRRILDRLRLDGVVECDASIGPRSNGVIGYDVEATVLSGSALPLPVGARSGPRVALNDLGGTIFVTESMVVVDFDAQLTSLDARAASTPIHLLTQLTLPEPVPESEIAPWREVELFGPPSPGPELYTRVRTEGLELAMPIEDAIDIVSPALAQRIDTWRARSSPSGALSLQAVVEGRVGGAVNSDLRVERLADVGFTLEQHRYTIPSSWGSAGVSIGAHPGVRFEGFRLPVLVDALSAGELRLDGSIPIATPGSLIELENEPPITVQITGGRLGSPGMRIATQRIGLGAVRSFMDTYGVDGSFDLLATLTPEDQTRLIPEGDSAFVFPRLTVEGGVEPRSLSMMRNGTLLEFDSIGGRVSFVPDGGRIESLSATSAAGSLTADGSWTLDRDRGAGLDLLVNAQGDVLGPDMRVAMPKALESVVERLEISASPEARVRDVRIRAGAIGKDTPWFDIEGGATLRDVAMRVGLELTDMDTDLGFQIRKEGDAPVAYDLQVSADKLRAGTMRLYDAQVRVHDDPLVEGGVIIPQIRAGVHGGIIAGSAWAGPGASDEPWIAAQLQSSGARAAPIFEDLGIADPDGDKDWNNSDDLSRGTMTASLNISGPTGGISRWTGRGYVRVSGGSVVALPGIINLIEASNFKLPSGSRLDLAEGELYLDGSLMAFERLSVSSESVEILGYGTMDWTSREVDLRFRSRPIAPIPVISSVLEGVRDELITTRVTGVPGSIDYQAEQFGTIGRLIDAMRGRPETEQQRRLREVQSRSRYGSGRLREDTDDRVERPSTSGGSVGPQAGAGGLAED